MYQAVGVVGKEGLTLMDGIKYQSSPLHTDFSKALLWQKGLEDSRWAGQAGRAPSVFLREGGGGLEGSPVLTERSSLDLAIARPTGQWLSLTGLNSLSLKHSWGSLSGTDCLSWTQFYVLSPIITREISISSPTTVVPPSNFLDNKLFTLILKQEWCCSKLALEMVKLKEGRLPFLDSKDEYTILPRKGLNRAKLLA